MTLLWSLSFASFGDKTTSVEINILSEIISVDHLKPVHIPSSDDFVVDFHENVVPSSRSGRVTKCPICFLGVEE